MIKALPCSAVRILFVVLITFIFCSGLLAQWSTDPGTNLMICDTNGEQVLSKIAMTSDAGCYISWFDTRSGSYNVYLQRLDPYGNKMWDPDGLLISNHPQDTWLTDWDLIADQDNNAVLVFSDIRSGGLLKPVAYKIAPNGDFLWGPDGIDISTSDEFQPSPRVAQAGDGNYVFAWSSSGAMQSLAVQKLSGTGEKLWGAVPIVITSATDNFSFPAVIKSDAGSVIIIYTAWPSMYQTKIRAQKLDVNGQIMWGADGISIQNNGQMGFYQVPFVCPDGNDGAFAAWYDGRGGFMLSSSFVQRIASDGSLYFPADGTEGSLAGSLNKFYPQISYDPAAQETYMFWVETDENQIQNGITGQKFSASGERLWGDYGTVFVPLSAPNTVSLSDIVSYLGNDQVYVFYIHSAASGMDSDLRGFACDADGGFLWPGDVVTLSNTTVQKLQLTSAVDVFKNCKFAWEDKRLDEGGIYAQDINPSGQLGNPVTPVELIAFTADVNENEVILQWQTASETNNKGFDIERQSTGSTGQSSTAGWGRIGFAAGNGTTTEKHSYSFTDDNVSEGNYIYRLKQLDFNGSSEYSPAVEVNISARLQFSLEQNYPNPFNPATTIKYQVPEIYNHSFVSLKVYDVLGNEAAVLVNEEKAAGKYEIRFDASNLASGVYVYQLRVKDQIISRKMLMLK